eukprot:Selendium_serpulae@DN4441_c0_g1_i1.p2
MVWWKYGSRWLWCDSKNFFVPRGNMASKVFNGCGSKNQSFKPPRQTRPTCSNPFDEFTSCRTAHEASKTGSPPWSPPIPAVKACSIAASPCSGDEPLPERKKTKKKHQTIVEHKTDPHLSEDLNELSTEVSLLNAKFGQHQKVMKSLAEENEQTTREIEEIAALTQQAHHDAEELQRLQAKHAMELRQLNEVSKEQISELRALRVSYELLRKETDRYGQMERQRAANGRIGEFVATFFKLVQIRSGTKAGRKVSERQERHICQDWKVDYNWVATKRYWVYAFSTSSGGDLGPDKARERRKETLAQVNGCYSRESDMAYNLATVIDAIIAHGHLLKAQQKKNKISQIFSKKKSK